MFDIKVFIGLSLPLTFSGYSVALNVFRGSSFLSLPVSVLLFAVFLAISALVFIHMAESEEKKVVSDHMHTSA